MTPKTHSRETEWKPRKMRIGGVTKVVYSRVTKTGNYALQVRTGRESVTIYRRTTPGGGFAFMLANYEQGKRRFDSYATEELAVDAALNVSRKLSERDVLAAEMRNEHAVEYSSAKQTLAPFNVSLTSAAETIAAALRIVGDLPNVIAAAKSYAARAKRITPRLVADVVSEMLNVKEARGASRRYQEDLRSRLNRFAAVFKKEAGNVTTAEIQGWLDDLKAAPQTYTNFRRVLHGLFKFAKARGYAAENPVEGVERIKVKGGNVAIFTPSEIARLLAAASNEFLPSLAIGAFAGLRSAEIERLEWSDIDLAGRHIVVGASKAKTASRRIVPMCDTLAAWLAPYSAREGLVWAGSHEDFYAAQKSAAEATEVKADHAKGIKAQKPVAWKANGLRHSYASYRFAQIGDAGRVAGELGNSAAVVHRHYRELVKPADAVKWFAVRPETPGNVTALQSAANV